MPNYRLVFAARARKDIAGLDSITRNRIANKLEHFLDQENPLVHARQLVHSTIGTYRFRVGHYRIVFDITGNDILVLGIKHRRDVYRS